jgi:hypothetical protein
MKRLLIRGVIGISAGAVLPGGAIVAQASSYTTSSTLYLQEKSEWCWAAATKTVVKHNRAGTKDQRQLVKWILHN